MEKGIISVDQWVQGSQAYFLTHLHSDHTKGLSETWKNGPLFCSKVTASLFPFKFPNFKLSLLRIVTIGQWHNLSLISPSSGLEISVAAIAIDANHCPGAVMYLFRGDFGYMLYTGDFRWDNTNEKAQIGRSMLLNALKNEKVHTVHLDNTYCNPSYSFPSREIAAQQVVNIITSYPDHDIIIGIDSLGKEDLLLYISRVLNIKIWVWPERLRTMHLLGLNDIFTTKTCLTRVRAVPRYSFSIETLEGLNATNRPTIGIMPSGLPWLKTGGRNKKTFDSSSGRLINNEETKDFSITRNKGMEIVERYHPYIYNVLYSDHSSYPELEEFVKLLQPTNIMGIVSSSPSFIDPLYFLGHLCGANQVSPNLDQRVTSKEEMERKRRYSLLTSSLFERKKRRRLSEVNFLGIRIRRVNLLRRKTRGVKLANLDFS